MVDLPVPIHLHVVLLVARRLPFCLVAIAEDDREGTPFIQGWVWDKQRWQSLRYRRHALFLPTGATTLPNGDLLVLERRFTFIGGFASRLVVVSPAAIKPRAQVTGREIARLEPPLVTENFEGLAAHGNRDGMIVIYLISDDNFTILQKTLLLKFALYP